MKKTFVFVLLNFLLFSCNSQEKENPKFICKNCGSFDLSKITFNENIDILLSKTDSFKSIIVNKYAEEKDPEELLAKDTIYVNKYILENHKNKILGEDFFNFHNEFKFSNLALISDRNKKIIAYKLSTYYKGDINEINDFISFLTKNLNTKPTQNSLVIGDSTIYHWETSDLLFQLMRSNKKKKEEKIVNGIKSESYFYDVDLNVYNKANLTNELKGIVNRDPYFVIFSKKYFK